MNPYLTRLPYRPLAGLRSCAAFLVLTFLLALSAVAQTGGTGTIIGRIFNPATQQYVRNAEIQIEGTNRVTYSGDDGSYILTNVPVGARTLSVTYTGSLLSGH